MLIKNQAKSDEAMEITVETCIYWALSCAFLLNNVYIQRELGGEEQFPANGQMQKLLESGGASKTV